MSRACPNCAASSIRPSHILLANAPCPNCSALIGVHRVVSFGFNVLIAVITLITTVMVLMQSGLYAAILWAPFPIGSLGYIKARFAPLEIKGTRDRA